MDYFMACMPDGPHVSSQLVRPVLKHTPSDTFAGNTRFVRIRSGQTIFRRAKTRWSHSRPALCLSAGLLPLYSLVDMSLQYILPLSSTDTVQPPGDAPGREDNRQTGRDKATHVVRRAMVCMPFAVERPRLQLWWLQRVAGRGGTMGHMDYFTDGPLVGATRRIDKSHKGGHPLSFLLFSVFAGRHTHDFGKQAGEIIAVFYPYLVADLINFYISAVY